MLTSNDEQMIFNPKHKYEVVLQKQKEIQPLTKTKRSSIESEVVLNDTPSRDIDITISLMTRNRYILINDD